jgi:hypothetical protein
VVVERKCSRYLAILLDMSNVIGIEPGRQHEGKCNGVNLPDLHLITGKREARGGRLYRLIE